MKPLATRFRTIRPLRPFCPEFVSDVKAAVGKSPTLNSAVFHVELKCANFCWLLIIACRCCQRTNVRFLWIVPNDHFAFFLKSVKKQTLKSLPCSENSAASIDSLTSLAYSYPAISAAYHSSSRWHSDQQRWRAKNADLLKSTKITFKIVFLQLLPHSLGQGLDCPGVAIKRKRNLTSSIWKTERVTVLSVQKLRPDRRSIILKAAWSADSEHRSNLLSWLATFRIWNISPY